MPKTVKLGTPWQSVGGFLDLKRTYDMAMAEEKWKREELVWKTQQQIRENEKSRTAQFYQKYPGAQGSPWANKLPNTQQAVAGATQASQAQAKPLLDEQQRESLLGVFKTAVKEQNQPRSGVGKFRDKVIEAFNLGDFDKKMQSIVPNSVLQSNDMTDTAISKAEKYLLQDRDQKAAKGKFATAKGKTADGTDLPPWLYRDPLTWQTKTNPDYLTTKDKITLQQSAAKIENEARKQDIELNKWLAEFNIKGEELEIKKDAAATLNLLRQSQIEYRKGTLDNKTKELAYKTAKNKIEQAYKNRGQMIDLVTSQYAPKEADTLFSTMLRQGSAAMTAETGVISPPDYQLGSTKDKVKYALLGPFSGVNPWHAIKDPKFQNVTKEFETSIQGNLQQGATLEEMVTLINQISKDRKLTKKQRNQLVNRAESVFLSGNLNQYRSE